MDSASTKPKLVFFQYRYDENLPKFLLIHKQDHVKCLSHFFDVTLIHEDCDYQQICDKHQPDLVLFESGVNHVTCHRLRISNTRACPKIPKLGLHNADAFCNARAGFLSDMDHWGIDTFFAISTTAAEHTPEIAENLFVWPNFVDPELYHDYGEWKSIPVLLTGNKNALYPWRKKIVKLVSAHYPSLLCPHPGYDAGSAMVQFMYGESYARTVNASLTVPTCGTVAKEVVRKHFEIPACRACLIAEKSSALEAAGFADMRNCVFADEHDVVDKLAYLFQNPEELRRITDAGYQLVHSCHTLKQRDQIFQWLKLSRSLAPDHRIVQNNPFETLVVVPKSAGHFSSHIVGNGLHLALLHQGDDKLCEGKYEEAENLYLKCINYMPWMPEPRLRVALCNLYKGNASTARSWIEPLIDFILTQYHAIDPDPVEWAYSIISLLCLGKMDKALKRAGEFSWLHHPELDRARWVAAVLKARGPVPPLREGRNLKRRRTIHRLPARTFPEWIEQISMMLRACGQGDLAETLKRYPSAAVDSPPEADDGERAQKQMPGLEGPLDEAGPARSAGISTRRDTFGWFPMRASYRSLKSGFRHRVSGLLHGLERKYGYFLPYHLSEMRNDEFYQAVQELTREEEIKTALILGARIGEGSTRAFLAGALANPNGPSVFCIHGPQHRILREPKSLRRRPSIRWYGLSTSQGDIAERVEAVIGRIKVENQVEYFDAILIDGAAFHGRLAIGGSLDKELSGAKFIFLDGINHLYGHQCHSRLLRDHRYVLVAENPGLRNGYGIFKSRNLGQSSASNRVEVESALED